MDDVIAMPIAVGDKIVPFKALAKVEQTEMPPLIYRENGREKTLVFGNHNSGDDILAPVSRDKARELVEAWQSERKPAASGSAKDLDLVAFEEENQDVKNAIGQLALALGWSIVLIFLTMVLQFGGIIEPLLVLVAIPLGFIGVLASLYLFHSSLSLNSVLGVILLNGIAVANSIILVDFIKRQHLAGLPPVEAAVTAARRRLRPILITSLTTILAMMPVALGYGEGGRILQPMGIAVSGGLWISMGLTLFIVPALHVNYLNWLKRNKTDQQHLWHRLLVRVSSKKS